MISSQVVKDYGLSIFTCPDVATPQNQKIVTKTIKFKKLKLDIKRTYGFTSWNEVSDHECVNAAKAVADKYHAEICSVQLHKNSSIFNCKIKFKVNQCCWNNLVHEFTKELNGTIFNVRY